MSGYRRVITAAILLTSVSGVQAMQLNDPRSAAVYIQKQRPVITGCLQQALRFSETTRIWSTPECQQLLQQDQQLKQAWGLILPDGSVAGIAGIPYELRKPTVEAYSEYMQLAERIAYLSR